jgi:Tol biopolymer transport system component
VALAPGTRLGPYEILAPLGAGGMGEVYKAKDTRLERLIALKVLPEDFFEDKESIARFEREARMLASLNHPGIAHLYSFEEIPGSPGSPGRHMLSMELADGETLAERLLKGPLSLDQVLKTSVEIASALDAAHRAGIVHRDVKPGNVMLTKSGAKLLDFGLAKVAAPLVRRSDLTSRPTELPKNLTQKGTILGTFQYMSPEQLEGKEADARSDIFAFGAVLYEMATGKRAFSGASQASLISAIMKEDPAPISAVAPLTPPALDRVARVCLAKDPEDRWQSAADVGRELKWIAGGTSQAGVPATVARRKSREKVAWGIAAIALLVAIALGIGYARRAPKPMHLLRSTIELPAGLQIDAVISSLELSPDGRSLALAAPGIDGKQPMYLRSLDVTAMQPLAGTEGATYPFWSPDGKSIAFFADGKLRRMEATGGAIQTICDAAQGRGGTWGPDGTIVFAPTLFSPLWRVSASGGSPIEAEAAIGAGESHRLPHFLPDGKRVLFYATGPSRSQEHGIYALNLATKKVRLVAHENSEGRFVPPGYLAFVRERNLMVQRFDPDSLRLSGEAVPVAEKQRFSEFRGTAVYSFAGPDLLLYQAEAPPPQSQLTWFDLDGRRLSTVGDPATFSSISLAPDGKRAVVGTDMEGAEHWRIDLASGVRSRFAVGVRVMGKAKAVWSPDGRQVLFPVMAGVSTTLRLEEADGGSPGKNVLTGQGIARPASWSPDGQVVAFFTQTDVTKSFDIGILPMTGDRKPSFLIAGPADENGGTFSPDGRWLAYFSNESGQWEDYVVPYPGLGGKWQISSGGNGGPFCFWNGNGQLIILSHDRKVLTVDLTARGGSLEVGASHRIFGDAAMPSVALDYSPVLQRFLIAVPVVEQKPAPITLVTNWTALLKRE